jgi:HD-like signal output (HDOD) protein
MGIPVLQSQCSKNLISPISKQAVAKRKNKVLGILAEGLPPVPNHILELNELLVSAPVDLKRISRAIRNDADLTTRLMQLCNSALFGLRRSISRIEEAAVLMGADRLRTFVFSSYLAECFGSWPRLLEIQNHWRQSLIVAILSERIARATAHPSPDKAYLGGLLRDIGKIPLLIVSAEEGDLMGREVLLHPPDDLDAERGYFGIDHCEAGRWIGVAWNIHPSVAEVIELHHRLGAANHKGRLVGIVALADRFCEQQQSILSESALDDDVDFEPLQEHVRACLPDLKKRERQHLLCLLEAEYLNILPGIEQSYGASVWTLVGRAQVHGHGE